MVKYASADKISSRREERSKAYMSEICLRPNQLKAVERFILSKPKDSKIVELGAGGGHFSHWLLEQGYKNIECVDADNYLVYPELKSRFHKCDLAAEKFPFASGSTDGVVAIEVIEHLDNMAWSFKEINRILKKGGWFIMTIPNISNLRRRMKFFFTGDNLLVSEKNDHVQNISHALVKKMAKAYLGENCKIRLIKYPVKIPFIRMNIPHNDLFADNRIYVIEKR